MFVCLFGLVFVLVLLSLFLWMVGWLVGGWLGDLDMICFFAFPSQCNIFSLLQVSSRDVCCSRLEGLFPWAFRDLNDLMFDNELRNRLTD